MEDGAALTDQDETRMFLLVVLVHSADLYNTIKPFASSQRWTQRLYREFNLQVSMMTWRTRVWWLLTLRVVL